MWELIIFYDLILGDSLKRWKLVLVPIQHSICMKDGVELLRKDLELRSQFNVQIVSNGDQNRNGKWQNLLDAE